MVYMLMQITEKAVEIGASVSIGAATVALVQQIVKRARVRARIEIGNGNGEKAEPMNLPAACPAHETMLHAVEQLVQTTTERDHHYGQTLHSIETSIGTVHRRVDDLYTHLIENPPHRK